MCIELLKYMEYIMEIKEKIKIIENKLNLKLSELSTKKCTVSIYETSDFYGEDEYDNIVEDWNDEEELSRLRIKYNDEYIGLPMYEACIQDPNDDYIDDTTTGRYCDIDSVIDEIEGTVFLLTDGTKHYYDDISGPKVTEALEWFRIVSDHEVFIEG